MKFKVLGRYGRYAPYGAAANGYLLQWGGKNIVIDYGAGCNANIKKFIDTQNIDAIILTHLHYDHCSDIGVLGYEIGYNKIDKIPLYMPQTPLELHNLTDKKSFEIRVIKDNSEIDYGGLNIKFMSSAHPVETYALKISDNSTTVVYTSDCSDYDNLRKNCEGSDYVIGDACVLSKDYTAKSPHISVKMLAEASPHNSKLFLAHLTEGAENELLAEAVKFKTNTELIRDFNTNENERDNKL